MQAVDPGFGGRLPLLPRGLELLLVHSITGGFSVALRALPAIQLGLLGHPGQGRGQAAQMVVQLTSITMGQAVLILGAFAELTSFQFDWRRKTRAGQHVRLALGFPTPAGGPDRGLGLQVGRDYIEVSEKWGHGRLEGQCPGRAH